ncbi:hypothetical protein GEMRC1_013019 [Eukaryota sp. GEM-RC1]
MLLFQSLLLHCFQYLSCKSLVSDQSVSDYFRTSVQIAFQRITNLDLIPYHHYISTYNVFPSFFFNLPSLDTLINSHLVLSSPIQTQLLEEYLADHPNSPLLRHSFIPIKGPFWHLSTAIRLPTSLDSTLPLLPKHVTDLCIPSIKSSSSSLQSF